jgi:Flp pilus assembly protein TadD
MPSRPADTPHTSLTNHRILAKPGEAWPEAAFDQTTAALPDLNHINRVVGRPDDVPELSLLEAYREIAERRPEYQNSYLNTLSQLQQSEPNDPVVLSASGKQAFLDGDSRGAITLLQRSIQLDPTQPMAYSWLSQALAREDRLPEAIDASEKAISLNQFDPLLHKALIDQLVAAKEYTKALAALQLYMELFPEDAQMRSMLALVSQ